jgi:hypothetical protein
LIEATHQVQIRPAQGELTELLFDVPPGTTITEVIDVPNAAPAESAKAPTIVSVWRFDPDARKLRVTLKPPQLRPFTLLLKSQVATGPLPFEQAVGVPAIQQAAGQIGLIGVGTSTEVQLDNVAAGATSPINLEDFPDTLAQTFRCRRTRGVAVRSRNWMTLDSESNIQQPDDFYQALIDAHAGLTDEQSAALNARLVLLLANQIGDLTTLRQAIAAARASV